MSPTLTDHIDCSYITTVFASVRKPAHVQPGFCALVIIFETVHENIQRFVCGVVCPGVGVLLRKRAAGLISYSEAICRYCEPHFTKQM